LQAKPSFVPVKEVILKIREPNKNIQPIIPDFLYLTKNRGMFIFVKPSSETCETGNVITLEDESGAAKRLEVIKTIPLVKIIRVIKLVIQNRSKSHRGGPFRDAKGMEI
jgi:hypothetical protein